MSLIKPKKIASSTLKTRAMTVKISEVLMAEWDAITQRLDAKGYEVESFQCVMADSFPMLLTRLKREEATLSKPEPNTQSQAVSENVAVPDSEEATLSKPELNTQSQAVSENVAVPDNEQPPSSPAIEKIFLTVSYPKPDLKALIKAAGGGYDKEKTAWWIPVGVDKTLFMEWLPDES